MSFIDILIPGLSGVLLVTSPRLFLKSQGEVYEKKRKQLRMIGFALIGVAILFLIAKNLG